MSPEEESHKAYNEGILRASLIRKDLAEHPTEYYPEKVRGLIKAYFSTIKEIIKQGEIYIDATTDFEEGLRVVIDIENYRSLMSRLKK